MLSFCEARVRHVSKLITCNNLLLVFPTNINPFEKSCVGQRTSRTFPICRVVSSSSCGHVFVGHLMPADGKCQNRIDSEVVHAFFCGNRTGF